MGNGASQDVTQFINKVALQLIYTSYEPSGVVLFFSRIRCPQIRSLTLSDGEYYEMVKSNFERADRNTVVRTTTNYTTSTISMLTRFKDLLFN